MVKTTLDTQPQKLLEFVASMSSRSLADVFPPSPAAIPPGLTVPSKAYQRHAWLALAGLLAFVALYCGLTGYLAWVVWRLLGNAIFHHGNVLVAFLLSLVPAFFLIFLIRGLFVVKHRADPWLVEVSNTEQPLLFEFLHRLADETGAPRPHRVFLSGRVNACVFYDLSFWNLIVPSKKNLELGLGLINVLSLDEIKAVVAHEYGHFAQRTMAVGRWVYLAQQIAGHIVESRGVFDRFLAGLSRQDLRIAWVGWILRVLVWALRAVLDTAFRLVVLAHRALSREMEFNADRVAVSVSGSDSLVHALHRLGPADEAWEEAFSFAVDETFEDRPVEDVFEFQTAALHELRIILDEAGYGKTPNLKTGDAGFRVFESGLAQPPKMWLTHPPNREREDSAKSLYVPSPLDTRSAWALFDQATQLRIEASKRMLAKAVEERAKNEKRETPTVPAATALARFQKRFRRPALNPRYRGVYMGRSIAAFHERADQMIGSFSTPSKEQLAGAFSKLYPSSLKTTLKTYRERRGEEAQLEGLAEGFLTAPGGVIKYRGEEIRRKELGTVILKVRAERQSVEQQILEHDRQCRAVHLSAARLLGNGWPEHLSGLCALLHFSAHSFRNLHDAHQHLHHVIDIAFADGRVSSSERAAIRTLAHALFQELTQVWAAKQQLQLPDDIGAAFQEAGGFGALSEPLGLNEPTEENLGQWLNVMEGWTRSAIADFRCISDLTLDRLLEVETQLATWIQRGGEVTVAPKAAVVPAGYRTCPMGKERERQKRLGWWDRFQTADGFFPGALRAAVAGAVLLPALSVSGHLGQATVYAVNGLSVPVKIEMEGKVHALGPHSTEHWNLEPTGNLQVTTTLNDGQPVETFSTDVGGGFSTSVYNVANASAFVEWSAGYGPGANDKPDRPMGAARWFDAPQDDISQKPPTSLSLKKGETRYRRILDSTMALGGNAQLRWVTEAQQKEQLVNAHLRFDDASAASFASWVMAAFEVPQTKPTLIARAEAEAGNAFLQRFRLEALESAERDQACATLVNRANRSEATGDDAYLALQCKSFDGSAIALVQRHPDNPFLNWAAANEFSRQGKFKEMTQALSTALDDRRFAPMKAIFSDSALRMLRVAGATDAEAAKMADTLAIDPDSAGGAERELADRRHPAESPWLEGYRALHDGRLDQTREAISQLTAQNQEAGNRLALLVAASDQALTAQIERGLSVTAPERLTWVRVALLLRIGEAVIPPLRGVVGLEEAPAAEIVDLLREPWSPKQRAALETKANALSPESRAVVLAMGVIVYGKRAPAQWRQIAKGSLFTFERPFFE
jgi:Zn-dependent protease with chaperone function